MEEYLKNKVALVTGSGRGIGRAIAIELAKRDITVGVAVLAEVTIGEGSIIAANSLATKIYHQIVLLPEIPQKLLKSWMWERRY